MFKLRIGGKVAVAVAALGGFLLLGGVAQLHAYTREQCDKYIYKAQKNVGKQIRQHGENSWQARQARRQLEQTRRNCGEYYGRGDRDRNWNRDQNRERGHDRDRDRNHKDKDKNKRDHNHDHDHDHNSR